MKLCCNLGVSWIIKRDYAHRNNLCTQKHTKTLNSDPINELFIISISS